MDFLPDSNNGSRIILYLTDPGKVREGNIKIIKEALKDGYTPIIITTNFPASVLEKIYSQNEVDLAQVYFIDAISKYSMGGASVVSDEHHINTNNPSDLTGLSIAISEMLKRTSGKNIFLLVDSISTMLIYLPSVKISQFVHLVSSKIRIRNEYCIILAVDGGLDPILYSQVSSLVDEIIKPEA